MDNSIDPQKLNKTLKKEFQKELKIDNQWNKLSDKELLELMEGVHKIKSIGGKDTKDMLKKWISRKLSKPDMRKRTI